MGQSERLAVLFSSHILPLRKAMSFASLNLFGDTARTYRCSPSHFPSLLAIYNHYVSNTIATFHTTPQSLFFLQDCYNKIISAGLAFLVLIGEREESPKILGYAYAAPYRWEREAYRSTVEITLLLSPACTGMVFGAGLPRELLEVLRGLEYSDGNGKRDKRGDRCGCE